MLGAVAALALFELWPPRWHEVNQLAAPPPLQQIAARPGVVVDLPLERAETGRALRHQFVHEQPLVGGYVSRQPRYETLRYHPLIAQLGRMERWPAYDIVPLGPTELAAMQCASPLRHLLITRAEASPRQLAAVAEVAAQLNGGPLAPSYADARFLWYELPLHAGSCRPFVYLGRGWHSLERDGDDAWRWAGDESQLLAVNPSDHPLALTLLLRIEAYAGARPAELWQDDRLLARWEVGRAVRTYHLSLELAPGRNDLRLRVPATLDPTTGRALSLSVRRVELLP